MKKYIISCLILQFLTTAICTADEIFLIDGSSAKTNIIDTSGCDIKIFRNNSNVTIKKKNVEKIILGSDTILFTNYVCNETVRQAVNFNETPEYKLKELIDNSIIDSQMVKDGSSMAYLYMPLDGNYNMEEFVGVQMPLVDILKQKVSVRLTSPDSMFEEFIKSKPAFDYAFITRQYHVIIDKSKPKLGSINHFLQINMTLYTMSDFVIYDLKRKCMIFRHNNSVRRVIMGENEYSWSGVTTPKKWQVAYMNYLKERRLDKNASSIKEDMQTVLSEYLHLNK
jgi:hypothetical protein